MPFQLIPICFLLLLFCIRCAEPTQQPQATTTAMDRYAHIKDEKARSLVKTSIEAAGGMDQWNALQSLTYTKKFSLLLEDGSVEKTYDQVHDYQFNPLRIRITSIENGDTIVTSQVSDQFSRTKNGALTETTPQAIQKAINTSVYVIGIPFKLLDPGVQLRYLGPGKLPDGRPTKIVQANYDAEVNANHSTSDVWQYHFSADGTEILANWVDAGDHFSLILNNTFQRAGGLLFHGERTSYRVDEVGNPLYVRARYSYGDYVVINKKN